MKRILSTFLALAATVSLMATASTSIALERGMFGWRGAEVIGSRPLLVIWIREPDDLPLSELGKYRQYYQDVIFGQPERSEPISAQRKRFELSVVRYYSEVSQGKFNWTPAGMLGPLTASIKGKPASEVAVLALQAAAVEGRFDFKTVDANHDGRITPDELAVLVIANGPAPSRHWQDFSTADHQVIIPGQGLAFAGRLAVVGEKDGFATVNRALFHLIVPGAVDLDGWPQKCFVLNRERSIMAAVNTPNPGLTMHLDPWHKMLAGWIEPRVYPLGRAISAKLAAQHVLPASDSELKRPILLFDPMKGPSEFFLLEYRTPSMLGFDRARVNSGLVVWQVALNSANRPFAVPADRKNCKGETLSVPSLFVRGAPNWQLGGSAAYWGGDGPFSL
jgi:hypothetical protein